MENMIVIGVILALVAGAVFTIRKRKKNGSGCCGCPSEGCCQKISCGKEEDKTK